MSSDNIKVAVRIRPLISKEISSNLKSQWTVQNNLAFQIDDVGQRVSEPCSFDDILEHNVTNANIFETICKPLIECYINGFNITIFAYGQTSSGKTHTMLGQNPEQGLIGLCVDEIFRLIARTEGRKFLIRTSYVEVYNETIKDLLDNTDNIKLREDVHGNIIIPVREDIVTCSTHIFKLMKHGEKNRRIGQNNMNERSSRSHTIFRIILEVSDDMSNCEESPVTISVLNLVDLAERVAQTKATGVTLREGGQIEEKEKNITTDMIFRNITTEQKNTDY